MQNIESGHSFVPIHPFRYSSTEMTGTSWRLPLVSCQRLRMVKVASHEYITAVATPRVTDRANLGLRSCSSGTSMRLTISILRSS